MFVVLTVPILAFGVHHHSPLYGQLVVVVVGHLRRPVVQKQIYKEPLVVLVVVVGGPMAQLVQAVLEHQEKETMVVREVQAVLFLPEVVAVVLVQ
jgi:hypothetical protein